MEKITARDLVLAIYRGDLVAQEIVIEAGHYNGCDTVPMLVGFDKSSKKTAPVGAERLKNCHR